MVSELRQDALDSAMHGASSSSSKSVLVSFSNSHSVRLDNNNYILWRRLILSTVRGHNLQRFIFGSKSALERFLALEDEDLGSVNAEFEICEQQDQLLCPWILSLITEGILSRVINCETSAQVWRVLE